MRRLMNHIFRPVPLIVLSLALIAGFFALSHLALTYLRENPGALPDGLWFLSPDEPYLEVAYMIIAPVIISAGVAGLFIGFIWLGAGQRAKTTANGVTVARMTAGLRFILGVAALGLIFVFVMAFRDSATMAGRIVTAVFGLAFAYVGASIQLARLRYDVEGFDVTGAWLTPRRFLWRDLEGGYFDAKGQQLKLTFSDGRKARVSQYFQGIDHFASQASEAVRRNSMND